MIASERQQLILDYINHHSLAATQDFCELTGASIATVRRDLNTLHEKGLLIKTHGGAEKVSESAINNRINQYTQTDPYLKEKEEIGKTASNLIKNGDIIFIGSGKTCTTLAKNIKHLQDVTIVTTNVNAVIELSSCPDIHILLLGGDVHIGYNYIETLGEYTYDLLNKMYFDKVFITMNGCALEYGYSIVNRPQLPLYDHLIHHCENLYLLMDHSKFKRKTFSKVCDLGMIKNIITDSKIPSEYLSYYRIHNIKVYID